MACFFVYIVLAAKAPVLGDLNFEEWIMLHYKHVMHHAKQFGLI